MLPFTASKNINQNANYDRLQFDRKSVRNHNKTAHNIARESENKSWLQGNQVSSPDLDRL